MTIATALMLHADQWIVLHWYWGHHYHFDFIAAVTLFFWVPAFVLSIFAARRIRKNPGLHHRAFDLHRSIGSKWFFVFPLAAAMYFSFGPGLEDWWDGPIEILWLHRTAIALSCLSAWVIFTLLDLRWLGDRFRLELKTRKVAALHIHCKIDKESSAAFRGWVPAALVQSYGMGMARVDMTSFLLHREHRRTALLGSIPESLFAPDGTELRWVAEHGSCRPMTGLTAFSYWRRYGRKRGEIRNKVWPWWRRWLSMVYWPQGTLTIRIRKM